MRSAKDLILAVMATRARRRTAQLACHLIRADPDDKELVLAELEFQRWLAESCRDCLFGS